MQASSTRQKMFALDSETQISMYSREPSGSEFESQRQRSQSQKCFHTNEYFMVLNKKWL